MLEAFGANSRLEDPWNTEPSGQEKASRLFIGFYLAIWPLVVSLSIWIDTMDARLYVAFVILSSLLYARVLATFTSGTLIRTRSMRHENLPGSLDSAELELLAETYKDIQERVTHDQISVFAMSILSTTSVRRRVEDRYKVEGSTLRKSVTIEFDLTPWQGLLSSSRSTRPALLDMLEKYYERNAEDPVEVSNRLHRTAAEAQRYVAVTLPVKGHLYDDLEVLNGDGSAVATLSLEEYRILAALTLRALISAAAPGFEKTTGGLAIERRALAEIIRFGGIEKRYDETTADFAMRCNDARRVRQKAIQDLASIPGLKSNGIVYAQQFVEKLTDSYAITAIIDVDRLPRPVIRYTRRIIPEPSPSMWRTIRGLKNRIRILAGALPPVVTVSARNSVTANTYHLLVEGPINTYVANFATQGFRTSTNVSELTIARNEPYWRVRGRRGQNYFHMYTRGAQGARTDDRLDVQVEFQEVPPGSAGRAGAASVAILAVILSVLGALVALNGNVSTLDTQVGSVMLAIPGVAAAWLGFDSRPTEPLGSSATARISLAFTFALSVTATVILFLQTSRVIGSSLVRVTVGPPVNLAWTILLGLATINTLVILHTWYVQARFYSTISSKPSGNPSLRPEILARGAAGQGGDLPNRSGEISKK